MNWKVGIICAGDEELAPFLPHIEGCVASQRAMLKFYEGEINGLPIVALYCGVCRVNAAIAAQILIDAFDVNAIINAGTAGGMDDRLNIFDTVISTHVAYHDVHDDILTQFHPYLPTAVFKADEHLLKLSERAAGRSDNGYGIYFGKMVTGEQFIKDDRRDEINKSFSPLSVDMETAGIAHVCYVNKIPFIAVRSITDTADHSGVEHFEENCLPASQIAKDVVLELLKEMAA